MSAERPLPETARQVVSRVVLAADESNLNKKFEPLHIEPTEENRLAYRRMLLETKGIEDYVSGVILFNETVHQSSSDGTPIPTYLAGKGIVPGIKVDAGLEAMPGMEPDKFTRGFDKLAKSLPEYKAMGLLFAKWRALLPIGEGHPTRTAIRRNAQDLALYAAMCQEAGLVPIVEPEVLMDGTHSIEECARITEETLTLVFDELVQYKVKPQGMILKPNMVVPGKDAENQVSPLVVAKATLAVLRSSVNRNIAGVAFLSGGLRPNDATANLNAIVQLQRQEPDGNGDWRFTASFGRALQDEPLLAWNGEEENVIAAQTAFIARAEKVHLASHGKL